VKVGDVLRIYTTLANPPKEKIVLHVHVGANLFLWFNTNPRSRPAQMAVTAREAPGITHDCFLDCGRATFFSDPELERATHCGQASAAFLLRTAEEIELRATSLTGVQRKSIAGALRQQAV
jgi:hypothetical protein